jgi:hypothetical protein
MGEGGCMSRKTFRKGDGAIGHPKMRNVVSQVTVEEGPAHDVIGVWTRGQKAGELVVTKGDGMEFVARLFDHASDVQEYHE